MFITFQNKICKHEIHNLLRMPHERPRIIPDERVFFEVNAGMPDIIDMKEKEDYNLQHEEEELLLQMVVVFYELSMNIDPQDIQH